MESSHSSRLSFYDQTGAFIPGPVEGSICGIAIAVPKEMQPYILLRAAGYLLPVYANETIAFSEWPAWGSGHYELFLECGEIREYRTVSVMPRHFTDNDFAVLIHDLLQSIPDAIVLALNACGAHLAVSPARDHGSVLEQEYFKLINAISGSREQLGMLQILPMLQRNCHHVFKPQLELRSIDKVRRPDMSKLPQAITIPGNLVYSDRLYQFFDTTVENSVEAYENRLVKAYVLALRGRLSQLQIKLRAANAPPMMTAQIDALANEFHLAYMRATFLREVRNASVPSVRVNQVLLKNPAYRTVLEGFLSLNELTALAFEEPALNLPLNNFPYLYQRWASLKVLSALLQVCAESGYHCVSHHWVKAHRKHSSIKIQSDGQPAVQMYNQQNGKLVSFVPWSAVTGHNHLPMGGAIFIEGQVKPATVLLFEPKYWVNSDGTKVKSKKKTKAKTNAPDLSTIEPLKQDIDEMLLFREQAKASEETSVIRYAAILYPGPKRQVTPELEALEAHPSDGAGLQKTICDVLRPFIA